MVDIDKDVLVYDIETYTPTKGMPDAENDEFRLFGCYSYKTGKPYILTDLSEVQKVINAHRVIVGFNIEGKKDNPGYDNNVLKRHGIKFYNKVYVDLRNVIVDRAIIMKVKDGMLKDLLMEFSLDYITKTLHLVDEESSKIHVDKNLFNKKQWTNEELKTMREYLNRDIEVTKKLYEFIEDYFSVFKNFVPEDDINRKTYLTASAASFVYKVICYSLGWTPKYPDKFGDSGEDESEEKISGGYVSYPTGEEFHATD